MARKVDKPEDGELCYALAPMLYATKAEALKWATFLQGDSGYAATKLVTLVRVERHDACLVPVSDQITLDADGRPISVAPAKVRPLQPSLPGKAED